MKVPFKDVEDFAHYHSMAEFLAYGEGERKDIENWIKETYIDPGPLLDSLKLGKTEYRPKQKLCSDWEKLIK